MSEENGAGKGFNWPAVIAVVIRAPALFFILGVLLVLIAAVGGWPEHFDIQSGWRIFVAVLGGLLISFGALYVWRTGPSGDKGEVLPDPKETASYGVTIAWGNPATPTPVNNPGPKAHFEVTGKVKKRPRGAEIWVFIIGADGSLWPHGPAEIKGEYWTVYEVRPGWGPRKKIAAYLVGKNGQILIRQYRRAGREIWAIKDKINEQFPNNKIEIKNPPITETTTDMVMCAELSVTLKDNDLKDSA
jgi:hypothetical protein